MRNADNNNDSIAHICITKTTESVSRLIKIQICKVIYLQRGKTKCQLRKKAKGQKKKKKNKINNECIAFSDEREKK